MITESGSVYVEKIAIVGKEGQYMKDTRYYGAKEYEQKNRASVKQGTKQEEERTENAKTDEHRYRMVEDENSIYEHDLNCDSGSEG